MDITGVLINWQAATDRDREVVFTRLHAELERLAQLQLRNERDDVLLEPAMLVNEAFIKLINLSAMTWQGKAHFLATAARIMRQVLIDHARRRLAHKRGDGIPITLSLDIGGRSVSTSVFLIDEGLNKLAEIDPFYASVVEARFFGGLTLEETAEAHAVSVTTVKRAWSAARAWLSLHLESSR